jgi:hypothetical protein
MTVTASNPPRAWTARQAREDRSWTLRLTEEQVQGFRDALSHARQLDKPLLAMEQADFPLNAAARGVLAQAIATTQGRWGMCLVKGFPVGEWTEDESRLAYWGMSLYMGVARTQNRASQFMNDVRNEGGEYKVKGGRGYNTNAGLDFHQDSCDVVGLLCRRTAKAGGTSKVISSIALYEEVQRRRPDLIAALRTPYFHSYQGTQDPSQPPYYRLSIFGNHPTHFAARTNRKNTVAAQRDFPEVPRMTAAQAEALDLLDELMPSDLLCFTMELEQGDMQLLNNYVTLHSRTPFEDYEEPAPVSPVAVGTGIAAPAGRLEGILRRREGRRGARRRAGQRHHAGIPGLRKAAGRGAGHGLRDLAPAVAQGRHGPHRGYVSARANDGLSCRAGKPRAKKQTGRRQYG